jgi:hypothetical protein
LPKHAISFIAFEKYSIKKEADSADNINMNFAQQISALPTQAQTPPPLSGWGSNTAGSAADWMDTGKDAGTNAGGQGYQIEFSDKAWSALEAEDSRNIDGSEKLSEEDQKKVEELQRIDRETRIHEQAHLSAAGGHARGGAHYNFVTGPDGKRYANGGHVNLDTGKENTPEATIQKAQTVRRAALAPAEPSSTDRQLAAQASKMEQEARREMQMSEL